jgi:hypothetical protein
MVTGEAMSAKVREQRPAPKGAEGRKGPAPGSIWLLGLTVTAAYVGLLFLLMSSASYDIWGGLVVAPVLILISLPLLSRQARREGDRTVFRLLVLGLALHFIGALARQFVAFDLYGGVADASGYHGAGVALAAKFLHGDFSTGLSPLTGTNFIKLLTGIVYAITGPSKLAGYLVFAWLGFWGVYFFYRAFTIGVPDGRRRSYGRLVFFLPSLVFWPAGLGKDAWMVFALGVAALGGAKLMTGATGQGILVSALGIWMASLVRPHVAGTVGLAIVAGLLFKRPSRRLGPVGPIIKAVSIVTVAAAAWLFVSQANAFLKESQINLGNGFGSALTTISQRTSEGGSEFSPVIVRSPLSFPIGAVQVLFRPFAFEAHNTQALAIAFEGTFLLILTMIRFRSILSALRAVRRRPYIAAALVYSVLFVVAFSAIANFGILARERDQLYPFFLLLLCMPGESRGRGGAHAPWVRSQVRAGGVVP